MCKFTVSKKPGKFTLVNLLSITEIYCQKPSLPHFGYGCKTIQLATHESTNEEVGYQPPGGW
jgi:hypothetical protein